MDAPSDSNGDTHSFTYYICFIKSMTCIGIYGYRLCFFVFFFENAVQPRFCTQTAGRLCKTQAK